MRKQYDLIIFDLDGTLVDSAADIVATVQYIIKKYEFEPKSDDFIRSCIGGGARNVLLKSLGQDKEALIDKEILPLFKKYYEENCAVYTGLYPKVKAILEYYQKINKPMALATYKIRTATEKIMTTLGIDKYFDFLVTADDVKNPKPDPECIQKILNYYQMRPEQAILVGDTKTDFMTGANAGVDVCAVTYGYGKKEILEELKPTFIVDTISEIKDLVL
ncbi:MAG: HAD-IA family hydrolase [Eubacterium sp.]|nr:HAD-IA family hydrolase [Eubacterium sp.]